MNPELTKQDTTYAAAFRAIRTQESEPTWLAQLRERSFEDFARTGLPTVKEEEWKYTNVAQIAKSSFHPVIANGAALVDEPALAAMSYEEARNSRLVFLNGVFRKDLSATDGLPAGLVAVN